MIQVEVSGQRLALRMPDKFGGTLESSFAFPDAIDGEASTAKWSDGTLVITVPKKKAPANRAQGLAIARRETPQQI